MRAWLSASTARVRSGSRSLRTLSDLSFGGWTLSKVVCAPDASFSASLTRTARYGANVSSRRADWAPNRPVCTADRAVSAVCFALCS